MNYLSGIIRHQKYGATMIICSWGVTDLQANQIYLYDFKGNLIPDFPAYGSSIFDMRILKKGGFQLVTLGDDNSIIFYQYQ